MAEKSATLAVKQQTVPPSPGEPVQAGAQVQSLVVLQKSAGNRAVSQMLSQSSGQPLDAETRRWMEGRFHADFSALRVYNAPRAAETLRGLNVRVFTSEQDIVFSAGRYAPFTPTGKRLLAHELTHTLQNRRTRDASRVAFISSPDSPSELEAQSADSALPYSTPVPATTAAARPNTERKIKQMRHPELRQ